MRPFTQMDLLRLSLLASMGLAGNACTGETSGVGNTGGTAGLGNTGGTTGLGNTGGTTGLGNTGGSTAFVPRTIGECTGPEALVEGTDTGFILCEEGYTHREKVVECGYYPRDSIDPVAPPGTGMGGADTGDLCSSDTECPGDRGFCEPESLDELWARNFRLACTNGCAKDSDCGSGFVCECGPVTGECAPATCLSDDDCGDEALCVGFVDEPDPCLRKPPRSYGCQTSNDECYSASECSHEDATYYCGRGTNGESYCDGGYECGRPFLVLEQARVAEIRNSQDWLFAERGGTAHLQPPTETERLALAHHFEQLGLMEHASIAAFARFSLQLLSLGAPARFIEATNQALVDETLHARLCFTLASRFAGSARGPGALSLDGALQESSLEAILRTTILEGCIGETVASLEASWALAQCEDEEIAAALRIIVKDEANHAQLAWQVVQWILEEHPHLKGQAKRDFAAGIQSRALFDRSDTDGDTLSAFGVLSRSALNTLHRDAMAEVIEPCVRRLLSEDSVVKSAPLLHADPSAQA